MFITTYYIILDVEKIFDKIAKKTWKATVYFVNDK